MFSFWRISWGRPGTLFSKEWKPSASMLGPGFERVRGTGVSTMGATDERDFFCLRRRGRGAMACPLIPGNYICRQDMEWNFASWIRMTCFHVWPFTSHSNLLDPGISKIYFISTDYWSLQAVVKNRGEIITYEVQYIIKICM